MAVEYRVRPITRYIVTRFEQSEPDATGSCTQCGMFEDPHTAHRVADALSRADNDKGGRPVTTEDAYRLAHRGTVT